MKWFHTRVHESVAFAAVFAVSITMQIAWISNVLVYRNTVFTDYFNLIPEIGPVSGLYALSICSFLFFWILSFLFVRARDVSHHRERMLWFFVTSVVLFLVMTMPIVYQVGAIVE